ncbi:hypothetical protein JCM19992_32350 [Thermostilla marina]
MQGKQVACARCKTSFTAGSDPRQAFDATKPREGRAGPKSDAELGAVARHVLGCFRGTLPPIGISFRYQLGVLVCTIVLLLLAAIYLGLIVGAAYFTYRHAVNDTFWMAAGRGWGFLAYLIGLIAGVTVVAALIVPLFIRRKNATNFYRLTREAEPALFALIDKLVEEVGSPSPRRVSVNLENNATAIRHGLGGLELHVGLPLVAGLKTDQLAGVIAHELGHFTQGWASTLLRLNGRIISWLGYVVFESEWHDRIVGWCKRAGGGFEFFGIVTGLVMRGVRLIFWGLFHAAVAVAGFMMREQEYDADQFEIWLNGSRKFGHTQTRLMELTFAESRISDRLEEFYRSGRLPDSFPHFLVSEWETTPEDLRSVVYHTLGRQKTRWSDTHPSTPDRIRRALSLEAPGVLHCDLPAAALFRDFDGLCRQVTLDHYRHVLGDRFRPDLIRPVNELADALKKESAAELAYRRFFQAAIRVTRPLRFEPLWGQEELTVSQLKAALEERRREILARGDTTRALLEKWDERYEELKIVETLRIVVDVGLSVDPSKMPRGFGTSAQAAAVEAEIRGELAQIGRSLTEWENLLARRLFDSLRLLGSPEVLKRIPDGQALYREAERLMPATRAIGDALGTLEQLGMLCNRFQFIAEVATNVKPNRAVMSRLENVWSRTGNEIASLTRSLLDSWNAIPFPLEHVQAGMTLGAYVYAPDSESQNEPLIQSYKVGNALLDRTGELLRRCYARLAMIGEQIEAAVGLPPLPSPAVAKDED